MHLLFHALRVITWGTQLTRWWISAELDKTYTIADLQYNKVLEDENSDSTAEYTSPASLDDSLPMATASLGLPSAPPVPAAVGTYVSADKIPNLPVATATAILPPTAADLENGNYGSWAADNAWDSWGKSAAADKTAHEGVGEENVDLSSDGGKGVESGGAGAGEDGHCKDNGANDTGGKIADAGDNHGHDADDDAHDVGSEVAGVDAGKHRDDKSDDTNDVKSGIASADEDASRGRECCGFKV